uniref:U2 snRNP-associated SURP motif-containing protein n=1 Tax=Bactrocera latifrons TaxID=174628 RepID=A0A0K8V8T1_BACLA
MKIAPSPPPIEEAVEELQDDIDGAPLSGDEKDDEDLDGIPLDGAALLKSALMRGLPEAMSIQKTTPTRRGTGIEEDDDIDGVPLDEDIDGIPLEKLPSDLSDVQMRSNAKSGAFIPSKWETVDPEQVEAQAITTSKWDTLDPPQAPKFYDSSDDEQISNNVAHHYDDDKRTKLREIEVKTMQYQDELEAGLRDLKSGWTISEQVEYFRRKLLKRDTDVADSPLSFINTKESRRGSESPDSTSRRARRVKRSPSPVQYNSSSSRSSPARASYKRSRSPLTTRREVSPTTSGTRSVKSSRRNRSRSLSDSPKKYAERTVYLSKSARYENSPRSRKSPSPGYSSSRSTKRDDREREYRNEKHKSRHKH